MSSIDRILLYTPRFGRIGKGVIGIAISAAFLALTLRGVDLGTFSTRLREINVWMLFPIFVSIAAIFLFKAFRWQYQMGSLKRIPFWRSFSALIIGFMANNVAPLRAGDLFRAHLLGKQEGISTTTVFATVALERVFDVASIVVVCLVLALMIALPGWLQSSIIALTVLSLIGMAGLIFFRPGARLVAGFWKIASRPLPEKIRELIAAQTEQILLGLQTVTGKTRITNLFLLAMAEWALWGGLARYSLGSIGIEPSMAVIMSIVVVTNLAMIVPAAPANIGVFEYAVMSTLEFYQVDHNSAFSGAVIIHALFVVPASFVGLIFFIKGLLAPNGVSK
jgi:uncharacterized protein (TIRG00374 family)